MLDVVCESCRISHTRAESLNTKGIKIMALLIGVNFSVMFTVVTAVVCFVKVVLA